MEPLWVVGNEYFASSFAKRGLGGTTVPARLAREPRMAVLVIEDSPSADGVFARIMIPAPDARQPCLYNQSVSGHSVSDARISSA